MHGQVTLSQAHQFVIDARTQKQLFENSQARSEYYEPQNLRQCLLDCDHHELLQHFLRCPSLHDTHTITQDFKWVEKWTQKIKTLPELKIILLKGIPVWMQTGDPQEIWTHQNGAYCNGLEDAICAQNHIGLHKILKGCMAWNWGNIQIRCYCISGQVTRLCVSHMVGQPMNQTTTVFQPDIVAT